MKFLFSSTILVALADAASEKFYTYYEDGGFGPSNWANLAIDGNQCGGTNGATGFGQSPVVVLDSVTTTCDTDMSDYDFDGGDCTWADLKFEVVNNGTKKQRC